MMSDDIFKVNWIVFSPKVYVHLEPQNEILLGSRVFADVFTQQSSYEINYPGLGWDPNPITNILIKRGEDMETYREEGLVKREAGSELWGHKSRNVKSYQELEKAGKDPLFKTLEGVKSC